MSVRPSLVRRGIVALATGAGIALVPAPALASTGAAPPAPATAVATAPVAAPTPAAQQAVDFALSQQGAPYQWGGTGPGYDCSGLVWAAYQSAGVSLPRTSTEQSTFGTPVARDALQPGDLVFFYDPVGHVGMYIGDGLMVHSSTYGQPVQVVPVDSMWGYHSASRVV
jgi:cell wall-associated NlpC family hydrolase